MLIRLSEKSLSIIFPVAKELNSIVADTDLVGLFKVNSVEISATVPSVFPASGGKWERFRPDRWNSWWFVLAKTFDENSAKVSPLI
jgi:hypothetical protein